MRSQSSNEVVVATTESEAPEPPATPENLAPSNLAFVILEDGVGLTWDAPAADADSVTGYRVLRRPTPLVLGQTRIVRCVIALR